MTTSPARAALTVSDLPGLFGHVDAELEKARAEIEQRFLSGGAALAAAYDLIGELLQALDGAVAAFSDESARMATARLKDTVAELGRSTASEQRRLAELGTMAKAGAAMTTLIKDMHGILDYIGTCASATRITGAGSEEFVGFADDIANYVRSADGEVGRFAGRLEQIRGQLKGVEVESSRAVALMGETLPTLSTTLIDSATAIAKRRHELEKIAERAALLVNGVKTKVGTVLSGLQIGDVTRQRIEHVQAGIRHVLGQTGDAAEVAALQAEALRLFAGLVHSLQVDFRDQTQQVLAAIRSLGHDAQSILAFRHSIDHSDGAKAGDPMQAVETGVRAARGLAIEIDAARRRAAEARDAASGLASELLDDMSRIGNLRNVRDDIRCLAINAYLRCARMGVKGRAVGVIATEMNVSAERLGNAAETILERVAGIRTQADRLTADGSARNIVGELDEVTATLRSANASTGNHLHVIAGRGHAVVLQIHDIVEGLDFGRSLGETLEACSRTLQLEQLDIQASDNNSFELIKQFSEVQYSYYTMASEREVHRTVLPGTIDATLPIINHKILSNADESLDDCLL